MKRALRLVVLGGLVVLSGVAWLRTSRAVALPAYGEVPSFTLSDERGQPVTTLAGKPHVVDFMFTSCPTACPLLTTRMGELQAELRRRGLLGNVELVSISVDPDRDTAEVLRAYGNSHGADPSAWHFLRGDQKELQHVVVDGMKQAMERPDARSTKNAKGEPKEEVDDFAFVHGTRFVLLDAHARIRGFYDANDAEAMSKLREDVTALADGRVTVASE